MAYPDHNTEDLNIYQMVLNRLPFVVNNAGNTRLISNFTLEVMNELEPCFKIRIVPETGQVQYTRVGDEQYYSVLQRAVIADIVSMYILILKATETSAGNNDGTTEALTTFLSKVKAGSVEVEYDQFKIKDSTILAIGTEDLLKQFKNAAIRKGAQLGCVIDITDEGSIQLVNAIVNSTNIMPFVNRNWDSCDSCGS